RLDSHRPIVASDKSTCKYSLLRPSSNRVPQITAGTRVLARAHGSGGDPGLRRDQGGASTAGRRAPPATGGRRTSDGRRRPRSREAVWPFANPRGGGRPRGAARRDPGNRFRRGRSAADGSQPFQGPGPGAQARRAGARRDRAAVRDAPRRPAPDLGRPPVVGRVRRAVLVPGPCDEHPGDADRGAARRDDLPAGRRHRPAARRAVGHGRAADRRDDPAGRPAGGRAAGLRRRRLGDHRRHGRPQHPRRTRGHGGHGHQPGPPPGHPQAVGGEHGVRAALLGGDPGGRPGRLLLQRHPAGRQPGSVLRRLHLPAAVLGPGDHPVQGLGVRVHRRRGRLLHGHELRLRPRRRRARGQPRGRRHLDRGVRDELHPHHDLPGPVPPEVLMVAIPPVRKLGRAVMVRAAGLAAAAELPVFLGRVLYHLFADIIIRRKYGKTLAKQVSDITVGVGALVIGGGMIFVIATMSLATGAMVGLQGYPGLERIGAEAFTGLVASYSNVREVTPIIAGVALVAQVGTGFTAEIGAMRISEEIDALEVMGINSLAYLVCTRVAAGVIALVPLYLVSLFMAFFATRFITIQYFGLSPGIYDYYFHLYLPPIDVFYSVIKVAV